MDERSKALGHRYAEVERETAELARATGLACPPGCGACCLSPEVEASPGELRLLAVEFVASGRALPLLETLARRQNEGDLRCALYEPLGADGQLGRCSAYAWRPLICRLFGFAARTSREDRPELVVCERMAEAIPEATAEAARQVAAGLPAPNFSAHAHGLIADLSGSGQDRLPINAALAQALGRALLEAQLGALEADGDKLPEAQLPLSLLGDPEAPEGPHDDGRPTPRPIRPRPAA